MTPQEYDDAFNASVGITKATKQEGDINSNGSPVPGDGLDRLGNLPGPTYADFDAARNLNDKIARGLFRDEVFIKQISDVWVNNNEARVRVEMGSMKSERFKDVSDFLLYKTEDKWKIFVVDPTYGRNRYGFPTE